MLARKAAEIRTWIASVRGPFDWPAAFALAIFRTRPAEGDGAVARLVRAVLPHIWFRPKLLGGLWLRLNPALLSEFVIYEEVFIKETYDLSRVSFEPAAIVDCGAFEGYFSLLARAQFRDAPIVAFEPNADNFAGLLAHVTRNHVLIDVRAAAVSTRDGEAVFAGQGCGGHLTTAGEPDQVRVPVTDLRRVIAELSPASLLLKIDIEGEEASLLPALMPILPHRCAMFFEWHHGEPAYHDMVALLGTHGFTTSLTRLHRADQHTVYIDAFAQRL